MFTILLVLKLSTVEAQTNQIGTSQQDETAKKGITELTVRLESQSENLTLADWELLISLYHQQGKTQQLILAYTKRQKTNQTETFSSLIRQMYAEAILSAGQQPEAIAILKQIEKQEPNNPKVLYLLGIANIRGGDLDEGIKYLEKAIVFHYAPAHMELAKWVKDRAKKQLHYKQVILHAEESVSLSEKAASLLLIELNN